MGFEQPVECSVEARCSDLFGSHPSGRVAVPVSMRDFGNVCVARPGLYISAALGLQ
ncbi:MAG: hypothetical protein OJF61_001569 [Rhodanobacteraceae bacterium]|nr:MAG: hypothetical protein OJF61_001569 [Rhodanobacteraceae bacterium]